MGNETIRACGVYTYEAGAEVDVAIHLNPESGPTNSATGAVSTASDTPTLPGFHTIPLSMPVNVPAGETFSIIVTVANPSREFTIPLEIAYDDYSSAARSDAGESYYQNSAGEWVDTYGVTGWGGANVCIKAYTTDWHAAVAPVANFTAAPVSGTAPLTVIFNDISAGSPTGWNWTFGDGAVSTDQHPTHTCTTPGTYIVSLTVTNAAGTDTRTEYDLVVVETPSPTARFDVNRNFVVLTENSPFMPGTYIANLTYRLHAVNTDTTATLGNLSFVAAVDDITWVDNALFATWNSSYAKWILPAFRVIGPGAGYDVRAGTSYTEDHVFNHTITRVCNVSLIRTDGVQRTNVTVTFDDLDFESVFVCIAGADDANLTATVIPGSLVTNAPVISTVSGGGVCHLELDETALIVGNEYFFALGSRIALNGTPVVYKPLVYVWEGMSHDTADLGETYTASLPAAMLPADASEFSVTTNTSCDWSVVRQNNLLSVIEGSSRAVNTTPVADFSASPCIGAPPLLVNFTDLSTGDVDAWFWSFGDGTNATTQHPTHTYTADGRYTVTLSVNDGVDTCTKTACIRVTSLLLGDANGDGAVNQVDTLHVLKEVVGMTPAPLSGTDAFIRTDVHENGFVDVGDAMFIAQYNAGLRDRWFVPV